MKYLLIFWLTTGSPQVATFGSAEACKLAVNKIGEFYSLMIGFDRLLRYDIAHMEFFVLIVKQHSAGRDQAAA